MSASTKVIEEWATYLDVDASRTLDSATVRHRDSGPATCRSSTETVASARAVHVVHTLVTEHSNDSRQCDHVQDFWTVLREVREATHCTAGDNLEGNGELRVVDRVIKYTYC